VQQFRGQPIPVIFAFSSLCANPYTTKGSFIRNGVLQFHYENNSTKDNQAGHKSENTQDQGKNRIPVGVPREKNI